MGNAFIYIHRVVRALSKDVCCYKLSENANHNYEEQLNSVCELVSSD